MVKALTQPLRLIIWLSRKIFCFSGDFSPTLKVKEPEFSDSLRGVYQACFDRLIAPFDMLRERLIRQNKLGDVLELKYAAQDKQIVIQTVGYIIKTLPLKTHTRRPETGLRTEAEI